jgi:uncharacterized protein
MRLEDEQESQNIEDHRSQGGGMRFPFPGGGGGGMQLPTGGGRGGFGLTTILLLLGLSLLFGFNPLEILKGGGPGGGSVQLPGGGGGDIRFPQLPGGGQAGSQTAGNPGFPRPPGVGGGRVLPEASDSGRQFVSKILHSTESVWSQIFRQYGRTYEEPRLVLFSRQDRTGCGPGLTAMGPFYCPLDKKVYIDLSFYEELKTRFNAPGELAQAYVIAHEVGHHVQNLLGIADKVQDLKQRVSDRQGNALQVRMELQADCLAGVWAHQAHKAKQILEPGDVESALNAANAIGDDTLQRQAQGRVVPDAFTHGTSEQRVRWFKTGLQAGDMQACDTFNASNL